jgi:type II secretory pathway component PulK
VVVVVVQGVVCMCSASHGAVRERKASVNQPSRIRERSVVWTALLHLQQPTRAAVCCRIWTHLAGARQQAVPTRMPDAGGDGA